MSKIKRHQCASCGGMLIVDYDKQMYRCASCGSTYDYEYFRDEQIHNMGETYLSRGEFMAAIDAYKLILEKYPHDLPALRGLMLAAGRMKNMDDLLGRDPGKAFSFNNALVHMVLDEASEEDKGYFETFAKIYYNMNKLTKTNSEIRSLTSEKNQMEKTIELEEYELNNYEIQTGYLAGKQPTPVFVMLWMLAIAIFCVMLIVEIPLFVSGYTTVALFFGFFFLVFIGFVVFVNMTSIYPEIKEARDLESYIRGLRVDVAATESKIGKLKNEAEELSGDIKKAIDDFARKDWLIISDYIEV